MSEQAEKLDEARTLLEMIRGRLATVVDPAAISLSAKIPFKVACFREGLGWRMEELGRGACDSFERGDDVSAIMLTRGVTETAAAMWNLQELVLRQLENGIEHDLDDRVMSLLMGHKNTEEMPKAVNVLTILDKMDKVMSGIRGAYDEMSEYAHPNWSGTAYAYSKNDKEMILTNFGRGIRGPDAHASFGIICLVNALRIFDNAHIIVGDSIPFLTEACEEYLSQKRL